MTTNPPQTPAPAALPSVPWERVDRFVGQFVHDIRNGLNGLELQLTLLAEISQEPEVREEVKTLRGGVAALSRELQAVRVAVGPVSLRPMPYPAGELLEDLRERLNRSLGPDAGADAFRWESGERVATARVEVDPEMIFDAFGRLFENALQFRACPAAALGFHAETAVAAGDQAVLRLRLSEHKPEPPPTAELDGWGAEPLRTTRRGSHAYGLGLFRARRIVEAHGGTLLARYSAPTQTLETTVDLPLSPGGENGPAAPPFPR